VIDKIIPTALRIWLGFLFLFLLLGFPIVSSILFGAIAGFSGGMISAWWKTLGGEPVPSALPEPIRRIGQQLRENQPRIPLIRALSRPQRRISKSSGAKR
jgi:pilus assembly protein TadC